MKARCNHRNFGLISDHQQSWILDHQRLRIDFGLPQITVILYGRKEIIGFSELTKKRQTDRLMINNRPTKVDLDHTDRCNQGSKETLPLDP